MPKSVPNSPFIAPSGDNSKGIFNYYLNELHVNPIDTFLSINSTQSAAGHDPNTLINWDVFTAWTSNINDSNARTSISFFFLGNKMHYMTHFSFKSCITYSYSTSFDLFGFNGYEWIKIQNYTHVDMNNNPICGEGLMNDNNQLVCATDNVTGTWKIDNPDYYYGYKWVSNQCSYQSISCISMRGIEIFGKIATASLSSSTCKKSKTLHFIYCFIFLMNK